MWTWKIVSLFISYYIYSYYIFSDFYLFILRIMTTKNKIIEDKYNKKSRLCYPTIKDTVQIFDKKNVKPLVPTINEIVLLNNQCKFYLFY